MVKPHRLLRRHKKPGTSPGTLVYSGDRKTENVRISVIDYNPADLTARQVDDIADCARYRDTERVSWINIDGLHDEAVLETIGRQYQIHPLVLEDILSPNQRPKMEDYKDYLYLVLRMITYNNEREEIDDEQFSLILGPHFVLTFQEKPGDVFDGVRKRLHNPDGRLRNMDRDYLAYALMDAIVDHYYVVLDSLGEKIVAVEEDLMEDNSGAILEQIHNLKREMIFLRKAIWPLREVIAQIMRGEVELFSRTTQVYLRDVYDHTIQVIDTIESYRDMLSSLLDLYMSSLSNRMNEVMKVLTIIATIFIPITFIVGVYGMNFDWMPELHWKWAYPVVWGVMIIITVFMLILFRRKRWL